MNYLSVFADPDRDAQFALFCDASASSFGDVAQQRVHGKSLEPLAFFSKPKTSTIGYSSWLSILFIGCICNSPLPIMPGCINGASTKNDASFA